MKKSKFHLPLNIVTIFIPLILTACGGGGGSNNDNDLENADNNLDNGSSTNISISGMISGNTGAVTLALNGAKQTFSGPGFTFTQKISSGEAYVVAVTSSPNNQVCTPLNGTGIATSDVTTIQINCMDNSIADGDYICPSHVTVNNEVIGNNTYVFNASEGECFGTVADFNLVKREVPVILESSSDNTDISLISTSGNGRLAIDGGGIGAFGANTWVYFSVDITNNSTEVLCFESGETASFRDASENELVDMYPVDTLGDAYGSGLGPDLENTCIPVGETRTLWGSDITSQTPDQLAALDHITLLTEFDVMDGAVNPYFLKPLIPQSTTWNSESKFQGGADTYGYTLVNTFVNMNDSAYYFRSRLVDVTYFDENNYLIFNTLSTIDDFLGIDDKELVDENYLLAAMGGSISIQDAFSPIVPSMGATNIVGRASKVVVHLQVCDDAESQARCKFQY